MDWADLHLGLTLATLFAIGFHLALATEILRRGASRAESRLFAAVNAIFAGWQVLQLIEHLAISGKITLSPGILQAQFGAQVVANLLVLSILFQLLSTFEERYQRPRKSLRTAVTHHLHRHARIYVPGLNLVLVLAILAYALDSAALGGFLDALRGSIGPTSAYLFGAAVWAMVFVLYPARPGQEKLAVPGVARALLLVSVGLTIGLIAIWHELHPRITAELLVPWLHLHTVAIALFLGFVRYEYPFMARFVRVGLRVATWSTVVLVAYWAFYRAAFRDPQWGTLATSTLRVSILLGAVVIAPWAGDLVDRRVQKYVFGRRVRPIDLRNRLLRSFVSARSRDQWWSDISELIARAVGATWIELDLGRGDEPERRASLTVPLMVARDRIGNLRLGPRRHMVPYFDSERRFLDDVAPLVAAGLVAFDRSAVSGGVPTPSVAVESPGRPTRDWEAELFRRALVAAGDDAQVLPRVGQRWADVAHHLREDGPRRVRLEEELHVAGEFLALEQVRTAGHARATLHFDRPLADMGIARGLVIRALATTCDLGSELGLQRTVTVRTPPTGNSMILRIAVEADHGVLDRSAQWARAIQRGVSGVGNGNGVRVAVDPRGVLELHLPRHPLETGVSAE